MFEEGERQRQREGERESWALSGDKLNGGSQMGQRAGKRVETNVRRANYVALSPMLTTDVSGVITGSLRCASFRRRKRSVVNRATLSLQPLSPLFLSHASSFIFFSSTFSRFTVIPLKIALSLLHGSLSITALP